MHTFEFVRVAILDLFLHDFSRVGAQGEVMLRWLSIIKLDSQEKLVFSEVELVV